MPVALDRQRLDLAAQPLQIQRLAQLEEHVGHLSIGWPLCCTTSTMSSAARRSGMRASRRASSAGRPRPSHFSWRAGEIAPAGRRQRLGQHLAQRGHARLVTLDIGGDIQRAARAIEQPARHVPQQRPDLLDRIDLGILGHLAVERLDLRPQLAGIENFAGGGVRLGDRRRALAGVLLHAHHERGAHAVDGGVGHRGGDDLALQAMTLHVLGVLLVQWRGEIAHQLLGQVRILRHVRIQQLLEQADLVVGQQHRQLRTGQALVARLALGQLGFGRQVFDLAIEQCPRLPACG